MKFSMGNNALIITEKAKNNTFIDCEIQGAEIRGQNTRMIRTKIFNYAKNHPVWTGVIGSLAVGFVLLCIEYIFFK